MILDIWTCKKFWKSSSIIKKDYEIIIIEFHPKLNKKNLKIIVECNYLVKKVSIIVRHIKFW